MSTLLFLMTLLPVVFMLHDFEGKLYTCRAEWGIYRKDMPVILTFVLSLLYCLCTFGLFAEVKYRFFCLCLLGQ